MRVRLPPRAFFIPFLMNIDTVLEAIPHRPPFLFIDEIIEVSENELTAIRQLEATEAYFAGHYPGNPIMPGVLMCEAVFQAAAIYIVKRFEAIGTPIIGKVPVLVRIEEARFRRMVKPGEKMLITVSWKEAAGHFYFLKGVVKVEGKVVVTVDFVLGLLEQSA